MKAFDDITCRLHTRRYFPTVHRYLRCPDEPVWSTSSIGKSASPTSLAFGLSGTGDACILQEACRGGRPASTRPRRPEACAQQPAECGAKKTGVSLRHSTPTDQEAGMDQRKLQRGPVWRQRPPKLEFTSSGPSKSLASRAARGFRQAWHHLHEAWYGGQGPVNRVCLHRARTAKRHEFSDSSLASKAPSQKRIRLPGGLSCH